MIIGGPVEIVFGINAGGVTRGTGRDIADRGRRPGSGGGVAPAAVGFAVGGRLLPAGSVGLAPQQGLAAVHGRSAPGDQLAGPGDGFVGPLLDAGRGQPGVPQEPVHSGLPAVGEDIPVVGLGLTLIGEGLPLVGPRFTIVGLRFPRISQAVTLVGGVLPGPGICVTGPGLTAG
jgi:hypothetical protein